MLQIKSFALNQVQENTYIIHNGKNALLIDPGMYFKNEFLMIEDFITNNNLTVSDILCTHGHFDHVFGLSWAVDKYKIIPKINELDLVLIQNASLAASKWGIEFTNNYLGKFDYINEETTINFNESIVSIMHIPGHSPGSVGFYFEKEQFIVSGDVLFRNGFGRTDLPFCNEVDLLSSIKNKLFALPDETVVYAGHGQPTTIGEEKSRYKL